VTGADARDRLCFDSPGGFGPACDQPVAGLRVAWSPDLGYAEVAPEVRELTARAARRFSELGCRVEEVDPGIPDPWDIIDPIWCASQGATHAETLAEVCDLLDPGLLPVIERGMALPAVDLFRAQTRREEYHNAMRAFMEQYDLLLTPTLPVTAFGVDEDFPAEINGKPMTYLGWTAFTYPFNLTGQPAATVPCGFASDGLPVGLQIVGRWRDDATVFRAAAAFERAAPWSERRPPFD
jgi:aspartyl-tRNA(Asn)/glutamyl-tRNA(Gln) amidotransferase subunit A